MEKNFQSVITAAQTGRNTICVAYSEFWRIITSLWHPWQHGYIRTLSIPSSSSWLDARIFFGYAIFACKLFPFAHVEFTFFLLVFVCAAYTGLLCIRNSKFLWFVPAPMHRQVMTAHTFDHVTALKKSLRKRMSKDKQFVVAAMKHRRPSCTESASTPAVWR